MSHLSGGMQRVAVVIHVLFFLGGVSALVYEVLWMRNFRLVFGSSTQAAAAVLAAYFAGMALGNLIGARLSRLSRPIRVYGCAEIAVGLLALLVGPWLALFDQLYAQLYAWAGAQPWLLTAARLLLAAVAIGPPTMAMGATLPLLTRALVIHTDHVARRTGYLYAVNIVGATSGALLASFWLPVWLGVQQSLLLAVGISIVIGGVAVLLRTADDAAAEQGAAAVASAIADTSRPTSALVLLCVALSGFGTMSLEVLYLRMLSQTSEGSVYSVGLMLAIFLLSLAAASFWVARRLDRTDPWRFVGWTQAAGIVAILASPWVYRLALMLTPVVVANTVTAHLLLLGAASAAALGLPVLLTGVVLPTMWKVAIRSAGTSGASVGALTGVNTLGGVAGALIGGFVLLPWLGLDGGILLVATLYGLLAVVAFWCGFTGFRRWASGAICVAIVSAWFTSGLWRSTRQPLAEGQSLVTYRDSESASVAVVQSRDGHRTLKLNHLYTLGSSAAAEREVRQGRLPLLLHPRPKRVALIGVATGMTTSAVLDFPVRRAVGIELVPDVIDTLAYFKRWNRSVFNDTRVHLVAEDGRNHLLGTREQFDVVISDLFIPWHAGTGDLYTVEHFKVVQRRLAPGGIFAQWLPGYQLTVEEARTIAASMLQVFPAVTLWRNDFHAEQPIFVLVGYRDGLAMDAAAVRANCARLASSGGPPDVFLLSAAGVEMLYVSGDAALREWARGAVLNTDDRPYIEYATPKSFFRHRQQDVVPMQQFLARFRPRDWCYGEPIDPDRPITDVFRAADLLHDAIQARMQNNFEEEYGLLAELIDLAGDIDGVARYVTSVAVRYRSRNMSARSEKLLSALVARQEPPVEALLALADIRRAEAQDTEAIALLERAVDRAPRLTAIRRPLVDLLTSTKQYARAEPHLARLVELHPDDPYLCLDLAHVLDQQAKKTEALAQIVRFKGLNYSDDRKAVWQYLRSLDLGGYVDQTVPTP